ncbi:MAG: NifU N-terminal domain-containing protein [Candidatus Promineifilaceae bacterium]
MSEYIEIESEMTDNPAVMHIHTNLPLAVGEVETYRSLEEMEEGSAVAQSLSFIDGIEHLEINEHQLTIRRSLEVPWHIIVAEVTAVLKDFFL